VIQFSDEVLAKQQVNSHFLALLIERNFINADLVISFVVILLTVGAYPKY
jgi:hypothetical protein